MSRRKRKKNKEADVYLWCGDGQKKFIGKTSKSVKRGSLLSNGNKKLVVKSYACGIAVVKEIK